MAGMTGPARVLLVDDDALVRAGLSMMLAGSEDVRVVAEASDGGQVAAAVDAYRPDVVLKDTLPPEIVRAIQLVAAGEAMLSPAVTRRLIRHVADDGVASRRAQARERLDRLTDREREVAVAIGQGKSNAEIAAELYMSVATVKAHVSRLLQKLELDNRVQIALLAHDAGVA